MEIWKPSGGVVTWRHGARELGRRGYVKLWRYGALGPAVRAATWRRRGLEARYKREDEEAWRHGGALQARRHGNMEIELQKRAAACRCCSAALRPHRAD